MRGTVGASTTRPTPGRNSTSTSRAVSKGDYGRSPMEDLVEAQRLLNRLPMRDRIRLAVLRVLECNAIRGGDAT